MENITVTVIVPVYNVEAYLRPCIDSIIGQTHHNLEIILVDDGSTDGSGEICDCAAENDSRIRVIHQKNGGVSKARNAGLQQAHGMYIAFIDSDDVYAPDHVQLLLEACEHNGAEIAISNYTRFSDTPDFLPPDSSDLEILTGEEALFHLIGKDHIKFASPCNKLYNRNLFASVQFPEGFVHEDECIAYQLLYLCKKVACIPQVTYGYYSRENSIMTSDYSISRTHFLQIAKDRAEFFKKEHKQALYESFLWVYGLALLQHYPRVKHDLRMPEAAKQILNEFYRILPEIKSASCLSAKRRRMIQFFSLCPDLYAPIMRMKEKF